MSLLLFMTFNSAFAYNHCEALFSPLSPLHSEHTPIQFYQQLESDFKLKNTALNPWEKFWAFSPIAKLDSHYRQLHKLQKLITQSKTENQKANYIFEYTKKLLDIKMISSPKNLVWKANYSYQILSQFVNNLMPLKIFNKKELTLFNSLKSFFKRSQILLLRQTPKNIESMNAEFIQLQHKLQQYTDSPLRIESKKQGLLTSIFKAYTAIFIPFFNYNFHQPGTINSSKSHQPYIRSVVEHLSLVVTLGYFSSIGYLVTNHDLIKKNLIHYSKKSYLMIKKISESHLGQNPVIIIKKSETHVFILRAQKNYDELMIIMKQRKLTEEENKKLEIAKMYLKIK